MNRENRRTRYLSYMLRLWQTVDGDKGVWRASLELPGSGARHSFANLKDLIAFLAEETEDVSTDHDAMPGYPTKASP